MESKDFQVEGIEGSFLAKLTGETRRIVQITHAGGSEPPLVTLDPVSHEVAHELGAMNDEVFLHRAIQQVRSEKLLEKALNSHGGPVIALLHL